MVDNRTELLAENSLQWVDGEKFVFLWKDQLIAMHFDSMRGTYFFISNVDDETRKEIGGWLQPKLQEIVEEGEEVPEEEEEKLRGKK